MKMPLIHRRTGAILTVIVVIGALFSWWTARVSDHRRREDLIAWATAVAQTIRIQRLGKLSGTEADLESADYHRLKGQLACARGARPECRFVYLMGRRTDGTVFFFVDSEPVGSVDESPAGQIYQEISAEDLRAFEKRTAVTSGPFADRWGTWISAMVPLTDPDSGSCVAVLGMDFCAQTWRHQLIQDATPPILLTLIMGAMLLAGTILVSRHDRSRPPDRPGHLETALAIMIVGFFLSGVAALAVHTKETHARISAFRHLVQDKVTAIATTLQTLNDIELEALSRLFGSSEYVTNAEFRNYTDYLVKNPSVLSWAWARPVPASEKDRFEGQIRTDGLAMFAVWQHDAGKGRMPAAGRDPYYPIVRLMSPAGNENLLGFDLGSEKDSRAALETAVRSGLTTASRPVRWGQSASGKKKAIIVYRPVFVAGGQASLQGLALAVIAPEKILQNVIPDEMVHMELSLGQPWATAEFLATGMNGASLASVNLTVIQPIFAFGETFLVTARAGRAFTGFYPVQSGWLVALAGLTISALVVGLFDMIHRKREQLERLVDTRTRDLVETRHQMELALEGADLVTWDWRPVTDEMIVNDRWAKIIGYRMDELRPLLTHWREMIAPEDMPAARRAMALHLEGQAAFYEVEYRLRHKAGHYVWVLARGRVLERDTNGTPLRVCGTCLDITKNRQVKEERERLQRQLAQSQKIEAAGRLAGGVAHDLNNLLSPIIGYGEMMLMDLDEKDEHFRRIHTILEAGLRARDLVSQLLAFSRKQALVFKPVDINRTIKAFEALLRRTIPEDIGIKTFLAPHLGTVMADGGQIEQVIMNLAVNAAHAMPDGGQLTIETAMVELDEAYAAAHPSAAPGPHLMLAVSDTGCGMDEATRERIFEPFFSTKGEQGTGLGLATVFGIVKQHDGNIWVYSEPGKGTTFKIYLPPFDASPVESEAEALPVRSRNGTETILLVEDSESVRQLAQDILEPQGYTILPAGSGPEALSMAAAHDGPVHLLLTDVVMPQMNGKTLFGHASKRYPRLKVLYMSGYTDNVIAHRGILDPGIAYIQKPFTVEALSGKVREVLDRS